MGPEQAKALREPFDPKVIGKLPKGGIKLDYVGHAAVTDRLLAVDPEWSWEPLALDERGCPALDRENNLWIKLTIGGVTRLGVGDGKNMKERIGDAIRNAAMRFGVALDLWAKEDLHGDSTPNPGGGGKDTQANTAGEGSNYKAPKLREKKTDESPEYAKAVKGMWATIGDVVDAGIATADDLKDQIYAQYGVTSTKDLTLADVKAITAGLKLRVAA